MAAQLPQAQVNPLLPQTNLADLDHHLNDLREELQNIVNLPGIVHQQNAQPLNLHNALLVMVDGIGQLSHAVQGVQARLNLLPLLLYNTNASFEAPLWYPVGVDPGNVYPHTKTELMRINDANITATLHAIGLAIPPGANIHTKRQILMDYLGTGITALAIKK